MMTTERHSLRLRRALVLAVSALTLLGSLVLASGCFVRTGPGYNRGYHNNNRGYHRGHHDNRGRGGVVVVGGNRGRGNPNRGGTVRVR